MQGSQRNRLGRDGSLAIALGISAHRCQVQFLHLQAVTIGNEEIEFLADALQEYY